jgi:hypothetical protein
MRMRTRLLHRPENNDQLWWRRLKVQHSGWGTLTALRVLRVYVIAIEPHVHLHGIEPAGKYHARSAELLQKCTQRVRSQLIDC